MADPTPTSGPFHNFGLPQPLGASVVLGGTRTGSPLAGSGPKGALARCCSPALQLGTISRRKLAGSPPPSLFVSVSDPCPALHIPNAGGTAALSPAPPSLMTPEPQPPRLSYIAPHHLPGAPSASAPNPRARGSTIPPNQECSVPDTPGRAQPAPTCWGPCAVL